MACRPWIKPDELRAYTDFDEVKKRSENKLKTDVFRAEEFIISYTQNNFSDYDVLPQSVKTACILLAEAYAQKAIFAAKPYLKEKFDEYAYELKTKAEDIDFLGLDKLLTDYVLCDKGFKLSLRKL